MLSLQEVQKNLAKHDKLITEKMERKLRKTLQRKRQLQYQKNKISRRDIRIKIGNSFMLQLQFYLKFVFLYSLLKLKWLNCVKRVTLC